MTDHTPTDDEVRGAYCSRRDPDVGPAEFDRWLADHDRHIKAEAWDEGYGDCWAYHGSHGLTGREDNPYRQEQTR